MELEELVLDLIKDHRDLNIAKIAGELKLHKSSDFVMLNKVLSKLEQDYVIGRNRYNCYYLLDVKKGIIKVNKNNRSYIDDENNRYYIEDSKLQGALFLDEVIYTPYDIDKAKVEKIIKPYREYIVGTFHRSKDRYFFDSNTPQIYKKIRVLNQKDFKINNNMVARAKIIRIKEFIEVELVDIIGNMDDKGVDISSILMAHNIPLSFPKGVLKEADSFESEIRLEDYPNRVDLSKILTITIDGDDAKDFDDAISVVKYDDYYNLKVHIADVSHYVTKGSNLDLEALNRGCSIYVCDRVVPMLPNVLSDGLCSLRPHELRLAMTCDMDIDLKGKLKDYKVYESIISSDYRMTYNNVNKIIDGDEELIKQYQDIVQMIDDMKNLSAIIREKRFKDGAIDFDSDEARIILDENGKAIDIKLRESYISEKMIEDFMIMANITISSLTKWSDIPSVYRVHESPKEKELEQFINIAELFDYKFKGNIKNISSLSLQKCLDHFKDEDSYLIIKTLMLRSMTKAYYSNECLGHYGLGLKEYCHFTSPIRRYPDLIVHRMLKNYLLNPSKKNYYFKDQKSLEKIAEKSSINERRSIDVERECNDMKMAEYMSNHINEKFDGVISSVCNFGFFVELDNTVEGLVHISTLDGYFDFKEEDLALVNEQDGIIYQLGQKIRIKVKSVDILNHRIDFELPKIRKRKQNWI